MSKLFTFTYFQRGALSALMRRLDVSCLMKVKHISYVQGLPYSGFNIFYLN